MEWFSREGKPNIPYDETLYYTTTYFYPTEITHLDLVLSVPLGVHQAMRSFDLSQSLAIWRAPC